MFQLGLRVQGAPKPQPPIDLKLANKKLDRLDDKTEDYPDDDFEAEEIKWKGLIQIDTVIYTTIKGELDIDEKDSLYSVFAIVALPNGTVELHDELYFEVYKLKYIDFLLLNDFSLSKLSNISKDMYQY